MQFNHSQEFEKNNNIVLHNFKMIGPEFHNLILAVIFKGSFFSLPRIGSTKQLVLILIGVKYTNQGMHKEIHNAIICWVLTTHHMQ